ncbi:MAG: ABC transporter permease [Bacteroidales bacterium]|nr:ABC transporter permease [Bacteroidales bacterium]MDD4178116.1 ABC transporter permease [Bacteroidales bacterium]
MHKIFIIIRREYLTRVRKKSFLIMTLLGPILMASVYVLPIYLTTLSDEVKVVQVLDESGAFVDQFRNTNDFIFTPIDKGFEQAKQDFAASGDYGLLYIPKTELSVPVTGIFYSTQQPSADITTHIKIVMKREVESLKLQSYGVDPEVLRGIQSSIVLSTIKIDESGAEEKSSMEISLGLSIFAALLIYLFIFIFGSQVMRGVIEEKTNRIIEVIISSVKPFELMMGKIVGVALVGLTQFMLWIVLTLFIIGIFMASMGSEMAAGTQQMMTTQGKVLSQEQLSQMAQQDQDSGMAAEIIEGFQSIDAGVMLGSFLFYFLFGYLLYGALFAAIGSAVDNETDTQQFMLPITAPLILSMVMLGFIVGNPNGPVAFWLSIIPFTSPVIMMARIPFGVPVWQVWLSMGVLVLGFLATTWLAAKIYRTGILMYGKRISYRELWKWIKYQD